MINLFRKKKQTRAESLEEINRSKERRLSASFFVSGFRVQENMVFEN